MRTFVRQSGFCGHEWTAKIATNRPVCIFKTEFRTYLFQFDIKSCCISNLDVIMALVHLNAKEATTVAMRTLSGLKGNEKIDFPNYFKELGTFLNHRLYVSKRYVTYHLRILRSLDG